MRVRWRRAKLPRGPFPVREWLAHRATWFYYAPVLGQLVDVYAPPGFGALPLVPLLAVLMFGRHTEPMCIQCVKDLPRKPREAVKAPRNLTWLRLIHRLNAHKWRPYLWMGIWVCLIFAISWSTPSEWKQGWPGVAYEAVTWSPMFFAMRSALVHKRFQYFCPLCWHGRGDNDDGIPTPDPEPVPTGTKELQPA